MQKVGNLEEGWTDRKSETSVSPNVFQKDMSQERPAVYSKYEKESNELRNSKGSETHDNGVKKQIYEEQETKELKYRKKENSTYSSDGMVQNGSRLKTEESIPKQNRSYKKSECGKENIQNPKEGSSYRWQRTHRWGSPNNYYRRNLFPNKIRYHKPYHREKYFNNYRNPSPRGYRNGIHDKKIPPWANMTLQNRGRGSFDRWRKREREEFIKYSKDHLRNMYRRKNSSTRSAARKRRKFEDIGRYEGYYKKRQLWKDKYGDSTSSSRNDNRRNRKKARLSSSVSMERNYRKEKRKFTNENLRYDSDRESNRMNKRRNYKRLKMRSSSEWEKKKRKRERDSGKSVQRKKRVDSSKGDKDGSDEIIHFSWEKGMILDNQYVVLRKMGDGTFGRVLLCEHMDSKKRFAIKVIRNIRKYTKCAKIEAEILKKIQSTEFNNNNIVRFYGRFMFRDHMCLVFERLGPSFYEILAKNNFHGLHIQDIKFYCIEILKALDYLRRISLTHTDLKPENILLDDPFFQKRLTRIKRAGDGKNIDIYRTKSTGIRIIDFGSAIFDHEYHGTIINTRQYRAPEVILNLGWDMSSDMWSLGCVLVELYTGSLLFKTHDHMEHLALMESIVQEFPKRMIMSALETNGSKYINREEVRLAWPERASSNESIRRVKKSLPLYKIIHHKTFCSFLYSILQVDPKLRPTPSEALKHEFFTHDYEH